MDLHTSFEGLNTGGKQIESMSQNSRIKLKATATLHLGNPLLAQSHRDWGIHRRPLIVCFFLTGVPCLLMTLLPHHTRPLTWVRAQMRWCNLKVINFLHVKGTN